MSHTVSKAQWSFIVRIRSCSTRKRLLTLCLLLVVVLGADSGRRRFIAAHILRWSYGFLELYDDSNSTASFGPAPATSTAAPRDAASLQRLLDARFPAQRVILRRFDNPVLSAAPPDFAHEDYDAPESVRFRSEAAELLSTPCDLFELSDRVRRLTQHGRGANEPTETNPLAYLQTAKRSEPLACREFAVIYGELAAARGYTCRLLGLSHEGTRAEHAVCEVYAPEFGKWILIDPDFNVAYRRGGIWLNAQELQEAWKRYKATDAASSARPIVSNARSSLPQSRVPETMVVEMVSLGSAGETLRDTNLFHPDRSGMNFEFFAYVLYPVRNDYLSRNYPFGHPRRWRQFLLTADASVPVPSFCSEAERPSSPSDLYWPVGRTCLEIVATDGATAPSLTVRAGTWTPNFAEFQVRYDAATDWTSLPSQSCTWSLHPGLNQLQLRSLNLAGLPGEPTTVEIENEAVTFGRPSASEGKPSNQTIDIRYTTDAAETGER